MTNRHAHLAATLLTVVLALVHPAFVAGARAQQAGAEKTRPRIGLCLAGGGARGGAHVGVLKVMEELRIPVDYIAGTSIGSIMGGLYASGYSPHEMDSLITRIDWEAVFKDTPPRTQIEYRRKAEDRLPYFGIEFGWKHGGVRTPSGLIAGQKLNFVLREINLRSAGINDFDDLPIPYRAVAADLKDGSMVIMDHGSVADAMRASMAIPGAFTPHEYDGRTVVDGGMVRNLPYDVVRSMGADVVIAVDVGTPVGELKDDPSFLGVVSRTLDLATKANVAVSRTQFTDKDLLMVPDLGPVTTMSFGLLGEAMQRGEAIARANIDRLRQYSVSEVEYAAWRSHQRAKRERPVIQVEKVSLALGDRVDARRVTPRILTRAGLPLDLEVLQQDIARIYRLGEFHSVDYRLERATPDAPANVVITAREKAWGPNYLRLGLALEDHFDGNASYNLLFYHRRATINSLGAEWRNQFAIGNRFIFNTEFYQPLTYSGRFFIAPSFALELDKYRTYDGNGEGVNVDRDRVGGAVDLGVAFSIWGEMRVGVYRGRVNGSTQDVAVPYEFNDQEGGLRAVLAIDHLDNLDFPRHGWTAIANARLSRPGLGSDLDYDYASLVARGATSVGRVTLVARAEGGSSFNSKLPVYGRFQLGGFTRISGLSPGQMQGDRYAMAGASTYVRIANLGPGFINNLYAGVGGEAGQTWLLDEDNALEGQRFAGSAFLGIETMLGPAYFGYGLTDGGDDSLYFYLGRIF
jgi:NTE family protein